VPKCVTRDGLEIAEETAADEIGALKRKLAVETRPRLEGFIASEQRVNTFIDSMREETRGWAVERSPTLLSKSPT